MLFLFILENYNKYVGRTEWTFFEICQTLLIQPQVSELIELEPINGRVDTALLYFLILFKGKQFIVFKSLKISH